VEKIDISGTYFCIPFYVDSSDRINNLETVLWYFDNFFKNYQILIYQGHIKKPVIFHEYLNDFKVKQISFQESMVGDVFHRTKCLNRMYHHIHKYHKDCKVIVNYDCDVLFNTRQIKDAYNEIINNKNDVVYPYYTKVYEISRDTVNRIKNHLVNYDGYISDLAIPFSYYRGEGDFYETDGKGNQYIVKKFDEYGSCIFTNPQKMLECGGENEKFISWGAEDHERYYRFKTLGYRIGRCLGSVYHMIHSRGINSSKENPYMEQNEEEANKVCKMNKKELKKYIKESGYYLDNV
jgi:hypothetical protein